MYSLLYCHFKFFNNNQIGIKNSDNQKKNSEGIFIGSGLLDQISMDQKIKGSNKFLKWWFGIVLVSMKIDQVTQKSTDQNVKRPKTLPNLT